MREVSDVIQVFVKQLFGVNQECICLIRTTVCIVFDVF